MPSGSDYTYVDVERRNEGDVAGNQGPYILMDSHIRPGREGNGMGTAEETKSDPFWAAMFDIESVRGKTV